MEPNQYKGLATGVDIKTDKAIEETCKLANASSNMTRGILYTIFIVSTLAFISFWNSRPESWLQLRIKLALKKENAILAELSDSSSKYKSVNLKFVNEQAFLEQRESNLDQMSKQIRNEIYRKTPDLTSAKAKLISFVLDSVNQQLAIFREKKKIQDKIDIERGKLTKHFQQLSHKAIEYHAEHEKFDAVNTNNSYRINMPIIGVSADINDLGLIAGIAFSLLLFILIFTLNREYSNLQLAFISISRRYTDDSEIGYFFPTYKSLLLSNNEGNHTNEDIEAQINIATTVEGTADYYRFIRDNVNFREFIREINYIRRQHHYNFLSMNEVFTLPTLTKGNRPSKIWAYSTYLILLPPFFLQTIISYNDFITAQYGMVINTSVTIETLMSDAFFWVIIVFITSMCIWKKIHFSLLWNTFYKSGYKLNEAINLV